MTDILRVVEVDCSTGITTERDMTEEEISNIKTIQVEIEVRRKIEEEAAVAKLEAKASAETKLLALGLTSDEIAALG